MKRGAFLAGTGAVALCGASVPGGAFAAALRGAMTQGELFAALPPGRAGQWTRVVLGAGAPYRKQIGLGVETAPGRAPRLYVETLVGTLGGAWNPSSIRKAYLRDSAFGSLLHAYVTATNVGRTDAGLYRYGEPAAATLHLLDEPWLYDSRPLRVLSAEPERIAVAGAACDTIHVVARSGLSRSSHDRLERVDLWHAPALPFGVARYRATLRGLETFDLHVSAHGDAFVTSLAAPLDEIRALT